MIDLPVKTARFRDHSAPGGRRETSTCPPGSAPVRPPASPSLGSGLWLTEDGASSRFAAPVATGMADSRESGNPPRGTCPLRDCCPAGSEPAASQALLAVGEVFGPAEQGLKLGWGTVRQDLRALAQTEVRERDQWYVLRSPLQETTGKVLQAAGIAIPPPVRPASSVVAGN